MAVLIFWWLLIIWIVLITAYVVARLWIRSHQKRLPGANDIAVAHSKRMTELPEFVAAFKKYRLLARWTAGALTLGMLAAIILSARPAIISIISPVQKNRDIMLCLDASGSVLKADTMLINRFTALVNNFNGQRFGLTLFNSSAVSIIPLNDNRQMTSQQLKIIGDAFKAQKGDVFDRLTSGTLTGFETGTSLSSDGLASCIQHLGSNTQQRSQSIVFATDNEINGTPVVGMTQAIELAVDRNIHVFVLDPGLGDPKLAGDHSQLKLVASQTDGEYFTLDDEGSVNALIDAITKQAPESFAGLPQPAVNDNPQLFLYAAVVMAVASLVLLWRLEL